MGRCTRRWGRADLAPRLDTHSGNKLKLGFFGANCSSGKFVSKAPGIQAHLPYFRDEVLPRLERLGLRNHTHKLPA